MFLELSIRLHRKEWPRVERALEDLGALSLTLLDAGDTAILEPGVGETPLWPELVAQALFPGDVDRRGLLKALEELAHSIDPARVSVRDVEDADWTRAWMDQYRPMRFGRRLWIYPSTEEPPADLDGIVVRLDPGLAFGTGTHPTTALCLAWLDALPLEGRVVLDYGCGSGILAIAALKLGAAHALGVDNDPQALVASRDNAQRNGVAERLVLGEPGDPRIGGADVVVANILAGALIALAPTICAAAKPGAPIALSGILAGQEADVMAAYAPFCDSLAVTTQDDWVRVDGVKR
jgi:ribosomal protein L11 methyltransferase